MARRPSGGVEALASRLSSFPGLKFFFAAFLLHLASARLAANAYVPGIAPTDYTSGQKVDVQIASFQSVQGVLPVDPYQANSPFCRPEKIEVEEHNLGQILLADRVKNTPYELNFLQNASCKLLCKDRVLGESQRSFLERLIKDNYQYQLIVDQLYALLRHYRADGSSAFTFGTPVGFRKGDDIYVHNHFRMLLYYHSNKGSDGQEIHCIVGFEIVPYSIKHVTTADGRVLCAPESPAKAEEGEPSGTADASVVPNALSEEGFVLGKGDSIAFTYDVIWQHSNTPWTHRWDAYLKNARDNPIIHWFSIVNSLVVVLLLTGIVAMILLRVLYRDIAKYNELLVDEEEAEETGWKLLHGDVFRKPAHSTVLAALAGSGVQLVGMAFVTVIFAGLGVFSPSYRGSLLQTMLLLWTFMGAAAGYTSARLYKMFKSTNWKMTTIRTALVFPGVVFAVFFLLNLVLWMQRSSAAVSFSALVFLLLLWFGISTPLVFLGAYFGFKQQPISLPVRINKIPRQIPQQPWFMQPALCCIVGGALPFGAMFTELFFLFSSIWQHRFYYLFGFLFLVLVILCVTCAEISITFVYFQLVCEDYLWWWRSFFCSASSGFYVLLYAVYYYHSRLKLTHATGALIYFGYSFIMAYACFILTGAIGFIASFFFLRKIYGSIKVD
ncbi:EMP/nonaspanin domain family protein [Besnoitia besnoiti]|uniref:Transmembrane 9 superfamily member n=1 Tax=Besnoitia besnoiti TaxID=94643 RepID=A0A2A9M7Z0_BESBE|nr:EMP/nonaspanin domain family protein [Besnoitia besnoiti]PFH32016.1 EMP/nonaspanin domain family protein [Besnoitia besnoiti]